MSLADSTSGHTLTSVLHTLPLGAFVSDLTSLSLMETKSASAGPAQASSGGHSAGRLSGPL